MVNGVSRKSGSWPGKVERRIPQEIWYLERRISLFFSSTENKPCPSVVPRRAHPLVAPRGSSRQMLEGAEEAEAAEASLEPRRNWGPVCGEQTDAIGAAAAVVRVRVSVLRRCTCDAAVAPKPSEAQLTCHMPVLISPVFLRTFSWKAAATDIFVMPSFYALQATTALVRSDTGGHTV